MNSTISYIMNITNYTTIELISITKPYQDFFQQFWFQSFTTFTIIYLLFYLNHMERRVEFLIMCEELNSKSIIEINDKIDEISSEDVSSGEYSEEHDSDYENDVTCEENDSDYENISQLDE